eukprot:1003845_1
MHMHECNYQRDMQWKYINVTFIARKKHVMLHSMFWERIQCDIQCFVNASDATFNVLGTHSMHSMFWERIRCATFNVLLNASDVTFNVLGTHPMRHSMFWERIRCDIQCFGN